MAAGLELITAVSGSASPGTINTTATVSAGQSDPDTGNNSITISTELTGTPDVIFANDFECDVGLDGCSTGNPDIHYSGPINHPIVNDISGSSVNWITGDVVDGDPAGYHFNPYNNSVQITFWWNIGGVTDIAGVSDGPTSSNFLILPSGATVGPSSIFSTTNNPGPAAWAAGTDGYLGFRFNCAELGVPAPSICYGYVRLTTTAGTGFPATIVEYAYNKVGNEITIP